MAFLEKRIKNIWVRNLIFMVAVLLILLVAAVTFLNLITRHNRELTVPDFKNITVKEAAQLAQRNNLRIDIVDSVYIRNLGRGLVSRQNPQAGEQVKKNRRILLTINAVSPKSVPMPNLVGYSLRQAKTELLSAGLTVGKLIYVPDIATNNVIAQQIKGRNIKPGRSIETYTPVDLVVGRHEDYSATYIPNVIGYKYEVAKDILLDNSLNIGKVTFDNTVKDYIDSTEAVVVRQTPTASDSVKVEMGASIRLSLSKDQAKLEAVKAEMVKAEELKAKADKEKE